MQDNPEKDTERQGYPAAESNSGAETPGEGATRRMDSPEIPKTPPAYQPPQQPQETQQWATPPQPQQWDAPQQPQQWGAPQQGTPQWNTSEQQPQQWGAPQQPPAPQQWSGQQLDAPQQWGAQPPVQYNQYQPPPTGAPGNTSPFASFEANPPVKDVNTALIIEIVAGLFGFLGLGHILSGRVIPGLVLLVGYWLVGGAFYGFLFLAGVLTLGLGCCLIPVFWLGIPAASGFWLKQELDKRYPRRL